MCDCHGMNAVSYIRVSGRGQVEGDGPERQREAIRDFCAKHELELGREFFEPAVSGTIEGMDRPAFADMLEHLDSVPGLYCIVVERLDRLARDLMVSELLMAECRKRMIRVYSVDQGLLIDMAAAGGDPTRVLIRQIMGALSEWEKSMLVKKLALARDRIKRETGKCEGKKAYGELPGEKATLLAMKQMRATNPDLSWRRMAILLNEAGLFTRKGTHWDPATVRRILQRTTGEGT